MPVRIKKPIICPIVQTFPCMGYKLLPHFNKGRHFALNLNICNYIENAFGLRMGKCLPSCFSLPLHSPLTTPLVRLLFTHANKFWHQRIDATLHILLCVCVCVSVYFLHWYFDS